jgi:hypothetical protein
MGNPLDGVQFVQQDDPLAGVNFVGFEDKPPLRDLPGAYKNKIDLGAIIANALRLGTGVEQLDTAAGLAGGIGGWMTGKAGGVASMIGDAFTGVDPNVAADRAKLAEQDIASYWYQPQIEAGQQTVKTLMNPIEMVLDKAHKLANIKGDWYESLGLKPLEKTNPRAAYLGEIATDLMTFKAAHVGAKYAGTKMKGVLDQIEAKVRKAKPEAADAEILADVLDQVKKNDRLNNELQAELQAKLNVKKLEKTEYEELLADLMRLKPEEAAREAKAQTEKPVPKSSGNVRGTTESVPLEGAGGKVGEARVVPEPSRTAQPTVEEVKADTQRLNVVQEMLRRNRETKPAPKQEAKPEPEPKPESAPETENTFYQELAQDASLKNHEITYGGEADGLHYFNVGRDTFTVKGTPTISKVRAGAREKLRMAKEREARKGQAKPEAVEENGPTARERIRDLEKSGEEVDIEELSRLVKEAEKEGKTMTVEQGVEELRSTVPEIGEWLKDEKSGVDIDALENRIRKTVSDFDSYNPEHYEQVVAPAEKLLTEISKKKAERAPVETEPAKPAKLKEPIMHGTDIEALAPILDEGLRPGSSVGGQATESPIILVFEKGELGTNRVPHRPGDHITSKSAKPKEILFDIDAYDTVRPAEEIINAQERLLKELEESGEIPKADTVSPEEYYNIVSKNSEYRSLERELDASMERGPVSPEQILEEIKSKAGNTPVYEITLDENGRISSKKLVSGEQKSTMAETSQQLWDLTRADWDSYIGDLKAGKSLVDKGYDISQEVIVKGRAKGKFLEEVSEGDFTKINNSAATARDARAIAEDMYDALISKLKEKRGSISLDKSSIESIKRLAADAERAGKKLVEYLRDLGLTPRQIEEVRKFLKETGVEERKEQLKQNLKVDISDVTEVIGKESFKKLDPQTGETYTVYTPKPTPEEVAVVRNMPDVKAFPWETRFFDNMPKEAKELFYRPIKVAEKLLFEEGEVYNKWLRGLRKEVSSRSRRRIGIHAISKQNYGPEILKGMKIKKVPKLTDAEIAVYEKMRSQLEVFFERLNNVRTANGLKRLRKVKDYFTFFQDVQMMERMGISTTAISAEQFRQLSGSHFRFAQNRLKGFRPIDLDAFRVMQNYGRSSLRHIHMSPVTMKLRKLLGPLAYKNAKGIKKTFRLERAAPRTYEFVNKWLNDIVTNKPTSIHPALDKAVSYMNRNLVASVLSGNLRSALIQVSALRNTAVIHPGTTLQGVMDAFRPGEVKAALEKSNILKPRAGGESVLNDLANAVFEGKIRPWQKTAADAGLWLLKAMDHRTAVATWRAAYRAAKNQKMTEYDAINYADDFVVKTQGSGAMSDLSPLQRHMAGRLFTTFQTFVINEFNFMLKDVLGMSPEKMTKAERVKRAVAFVGATMAINSFYEDVVGIPSPYPTPIRTAQRSFGDDKSVSKAAFEGLKEIGEIIPIIGGAIKYGKGTSGPILSSLDEFVKNPDVISVGQKMWAGEELSNKDINTVSQAARLLGVPYTNQIVKSLKRYREDPDDYWAILTGGNPKEREQKPKLMKPGRKPKLESKK